MIRNHRELLVCALTDESPNVRLIAAEGLARWGTPEDQIHARQILLGAASFQNGSVYLALASLNAIDSLDSRSVDLLRGIHQIPTQVPAEFSRPGPGIERLVRHITQSSAP